MLLTDWSRGAHIHGASDNTSGVVAALEVVARWLAHAPEGVELVLRFTS